MDDIVVQGVSAQIQQSVIEGDQDKILQHEVEVDTGAEGLSVSRCHKVLYRVIMTRYHAGDTG